MGRYDFITADTLAVNPVEPKHMMRIPHDIYIQIVKTAALNEMPPATFLIQLLRKTFPKGDKA